MGAGTGTVVGSAIAARAIASMPGVPIEPPLPELMAAPDLPLVHREFGNRAWGRLIALGPRQRRTDQRPMRRPDIVARRFVRLDLAVPVPRRVGGELRRLNRFGFRRTRFGRRLRSDQLAARICEHFVIEFARGVLLAAPWGLAGPVDVLGGAGGAPR